MMSMQDLFYGGSEPVWVLKPEKNDNKKGDDKSSSSGGGGGGGKKAAAKDDDTILATIPFYPYYYPDYIAPQTKKDSGKENDKETKVVMKVPICCGECVDSIQVALYALKGVKYVECNVLKKRVTVVTTTAAAADILLECRGVFRKSRMWSDDD